MKIKCYIKVGKTGKGRAGYKLSIHNKINHKSMDNGQQINTEYYPTINIPLQLEIPDECFADVHKALQIKVENHIKAVEVNVKNEEGVVMKNEVE